MSVQWGEADLDVAHAEVRKDPTRKSNSPWPHVDNGHFRNAESTIQAPQPISSRPEARLSQGLQAVCHIAGLVFRSIRALVHPIAPRQPACCSHAGGIISVNALLSFMGERRSSWPILPTRTSPDRSSPISAS